MVQNGGSWTPIACWPGVPLIREAGPVAERNSTGVTGWGKDTAVLP